MTLFSSQKDQVIPQPENSEVKEVFSFYGLCMYNAQILEQELINLTVALIAKNATKLSKNDFDNLFSKAGSKTLGQLIHDLKRKVEFPKKLEESLINAKNNRNFVAHDFFKHHSINFGAERGRSHMIQKLRGYTRGFMTVISSVEKITEQLYKALGITEEIVQKEFDKMEAEVRAIDEEVNKYSTDG